MSVNHVVDYTVNTFYHSFSKQSGTTWVARWVKAFLYCFIAVQVFSILLEWLNNYCVTPPGLFLQMLFLLLMSGIIELISMQLSNITDYCVLDYAKNLVTILQQRFFIRKVTVVATFDQIRVIGVSAALPGFFRNLISKSANNFALVIMNDHNHLIHITEHELSLDEANALALELSTRYMQSARLLMGEPDIELVADSMTGDVNARVVQRTTMALIDATILPTLQAFAGFVLATSLLIIIIAALGKISSEVISTDLMVAHQPVAQLFLTPAPRPADLASATLPLVSVAISQPAGQHASSQNATSAASVASAPIAAEVTPDTTTSLASPAVETVLYQASESLPVAPIPEPGVASPVTDQAATVTAANDALPVTSPQLPPKVEVAEPEHLKPQIADPFKVSYPAQTPTRPQTVTATIPRPARPNASYEPTPMPQLLPLPLNQPLQARIPEITPEALAALKRPGYRPVTTAPVSDAISIHGVPGASAHGTDPIAQALPSDPVSSAGSIGSADASELAGSTDPVVSEVRADVIPVNLPVLPPTARVQLAMAITDKQPATAPTAPDCSILAGHGLLSVVELGDSSAAVLKRLGSPLAENTTGGMNQYVYSGFSFAAEAKTGLINQVTITRRTVKYGNCLTPHNLAIGSPLNTIKQQFGPPTIIDGLPGLHFPNLGISFIPAAQNPQTVGAIKIYPAGSRPD
ncbi:MAG TPA: hypothetical protein PKM56_15915 [Candidatus Rifleibacterium sp.]|nr:hypothetical protein [Candidatus Rifleibacterium sp.]